MSFAVAKPNALRYPHSLPPDHNAMDVGQGPDVGALLNVFVAELGRETRLLQQVVTLRTRASDSESRARMAPLFNEVDAVVSRLEANVEILRKYHSIRAAAVAADTAQAELHAQATDARIAAIRAQLPDELLHALRRKETEPEVSNIEEERPPLANVESNDSQCNIPVSNQGNPGSRKAPAAGSGGGRERKETSQVRKPPSGKPGKSAAAPASQRETQSEGICDERSQGGSDDDAFSIKNITQQDLSNAPSYVRGRLTVERSRSVVTALNKVLMAKYEFLGQDARNLSSDDVTRRQDMQAVEADCIEIAGRPFFTDADCKHEGVRFDAITKSVVNMLRHVSILKEVRGKNKVRVFIVVNA